MENTKAIKVFQVLRDGAFLWKNNFFPFSKLYLLLYIPIAMFSIWWAMITQGASAQSGNWLSALLLFIIMGLGMWADIALIKAANKASIGERIAVLQNAGGAGKYFLPYLGVLLLSSLLFLGIITAGLGGGFGLSFLTGFLHAHLRGAAQIAGLVIGIVVTAAFVVTAICYLVYFGIRLLLAYYACVLEAKGPVFSLKRSFSLVKKHVNPVVGVFAALLCVAIVLYLAPAILLSIFIKNPQQLNIAGTIVQYGMGLVFVPLTRAILLKLYQQLQEGGEAAVQAVIQ